MGPPGAGGALPPARPHRRVTFGPTAVEAGGEGGTSQGATERPGAEGGETQGSTGGNEPTEAEGGEGAPEGAAEGGAAEHSPVEAGPPAPEGGKVTLLGPGDAKRGDELCVSRGTIYGSPFIARGSDEGAVLQAAYRELLRGAAKPRSIGKALGGKTRRGGTLRVHEGSERTPAHSRLRALLGLARRAIRGEQLYLRCRSCDPELCHGAVIREWIEARMRPMINRE